MNDTTSPAPPAPPQATDKKGALHREKVLAKLDEMVALLRALVVNVAKKDFAGGASAGYDVAYADRFMENKKAVDRIVREEIVRYANKRKK